MKIWKAGCYLNFQPIQYPLMTTSGTKILRSSILPTEVVVMEISTKMTIQSPTIAQSHCRAEHRNVLSMNTSLVRVNTTRMRMKVQNGILQDLLVRIMDTFAYIDISRPSQIQNVHELSEDVECFHLFDGIFSL